MTTPLLPLVEQPDLFGDTDRADRARFTDGLVCLAESEPKALEILIGIRTPDRGQCKAGKSGRWAYRATSAGFRFELVETWGGWDHSPRGLLLWSELDALTSDDSRLDEIRAWAGTLTEPDAWKDLYRPHELWPDPETWHPSYIEGDHDRAGWADRRRAWDMALEVLTDAQERVVIDA